MSLLNSVVFNNWFSYWLINFFLSVVSFALQAGLNKVPLSCFHFLSALSCWEGIWGGSLVRSDCWVDFGQRRSYRWLLGACGQCCWVLIIWWVFVFVVVEFCLNLTINVRECVPFQICSVVQTLCSREVIQELIIAEAVSKGFVAQGFVWPFAQHIFILSISVLPRSEGIWFSQPCGAATVLQTVDSGSQTMTSWSLWWDMPVRLGDFSYVSFLHFYGLH